MNLLYTLIAASRLNQNWISRPPQCAKTGQIIGTDIEVCRNAGLANI